MATGGEGTFFELDQARTDWAAGTLVLDDDEITERATASEGWVGVVALVVDDAGSNQVLIADLSVGVPEPGVWLQGRFLPTDSEPVSKAGWGTLVADDDAPWGLRLTNLTGPGIPDRSDPYGTTGVRCASPVGGPLDLAWLAQGVCTRSDLVGHRVSFGHVP
jgi:hypothetical protein